MNEERTNITWGRVRHSRLRYDQRNVSPYSLPLHVQSSKKSNGAGLNQAIRCPERELFKSLKLNRNTIDAAYHELAMQGWLTTKPARGTYVAADLPDTVKRDKTKRANDVATKLIHSEERLTLRLSDGSPTSALSPRQPSHKHFAGLSPVSLSLPEASMVILAALELCEMHFLPISATNAAWRQPRPKS